MTIVRVPGFRLDYMEARYYGWRHSIHFGFWLIFLGRMTEQEIREYEP